MVNVLGISIGTRNVGMAVIRLRTLTDYRIRTLAGKWTETKCESIWSIVESLIRQHGITDITIKIPRPSHCSENLHELINGIKGHAHWYNIKVHTCTMPDIRAWYSSEKTTSKKAMIFALIERYPELAKEWNNGKRAHSYNAKLFEAIACAELALRAGH